MDAGRIVSFLLKRRRKTQHHRGTEGPEGPEKISVRDALQPSIQHALHREIQAAELLAHGGIAIRQARDDVLGIPAYAAIASRVRG